jgi:8-oxo-dGTP diphosphatase
LLVEGNPPERVLLGLKKHGFGAGKWGGFGGKIEPGETLDMTAIRELEEEAAIKVAARDLTLVGHLTFIFPHQREWSQVVYAFVAKRWLGELAESDEMEPAWFDVEDIPYDRMWQDGMYWLPRVLAGERVQARFTFCADNQTVDDAQVENWDGIV